MLEIDGTKQSHARRTSFPQNKQETFKRAALLFVCCLVAGISFAASGASAFTLSVSVPSGLPPASSSDPVVVAAGNIACPAANPPSARGCQQSATADLVLPANPTAVLTLGDTQYECGEAAQFNSSFATSWGRFKALIHPAPGNHDYNVGDETPVCAGEPQDGDGYYGYFGAAANPLDPSCLKNCQGYYSFDLGSWHLIALNSNCAQVGGCGANSPEAAWLSADLAAHPNACTLAYGHHPRFSSGASHGDNNEMQTFWSILSKAGADLVLNGHAHDYERFAPTNASGAVDPGGTREFVVGTGGRDLAGFKATPDAASEARGNDFGVLKLGLHQGWYDWQFMPTAGESFTDAGVSVCQNSSTAAHAAASNSVGAGQASASPAVRLASPTAASSPIAASLVLASQNGVLLADAFEASGFAQWSNATGTANVASADNHFMRVTEGGSAPTAKLKEPAPDLYASLRFRLPVGEHANVSIVSLLGKDGKPIATARVNAQGMLEIDGGSGGPALVSRTPVTPGLWHDLQIHLQLDTSGAHLEVWYDGVGIPALRGDLQAHADQATSVQLGGAGSAAATVDIDNLVVATKPVDGAMVAAMAPTTTATIAMPTPTVTPNASPAVHASPSPVGSPVAASVGGTSGALPAASAHRNSGSSLSLVRRIVSPLVLLISLFLTVQGFFTLSLMLYTWARTDRLIASGSPTEFAEPTLRFTALLPARHEREVIAQTVRRVWSANYPKDRLEVVVVCEHKDLETIAEAERAAAEIGHPNVRVATFSDGPINKPHGLNVAFRETTHEVVTIFDAEDDVHPDIFNVANTVMQRDGAGIVQAGVQLMDFQSTWFAVHNVLEYFFWFKSRLHFHAQVGMVPLGGNTVFMRRRLVEMVGGWDEQCLTEDADIGIRLSTLGERITITYDADHATREETPPSISQFIKQRTRWNQGFIQVLRKRIWKRFPNRTQRLLAAYTLTYPFTQSFFGLLWLPALIATFALKLNVAVAMVSLLPLYALIFQFAANLIGLFDFARAYHLRIRLRDLLIFTISFMPYQMLLSFGALRAVYREQRGRTNWEKTAHTGAHRVAAPARALKGDAP